MPVADMEFPVADEILAAIDKITEHKILGYSIVPESLQIAAQKKIARDYAWETKLEWQVWIPGIVPGITAACAAFSSPQDGILNSCSRLSSLSFGCGLVGSSSIYFSDD